MSKCLSVKTRKVFFTGLAVAMIVLLLAGSALSMGHDPVERLFGANRWATSANVALEAYPDGSDSVIIARGDDTGGWADGLTGGYLAGVLDAPILLTAPDYLPGEVATAIGTLDPDTAYILGGTAAVSAEVEADLIALGLKIERISGANREATAVEIAGMGLVADNTAFVVQGHAPADSMVAGAAAFAKGYPILLVGQDNIPVVTSAAIVDLGIENIIIVGGTAVVSADVATALGALDGVISVTRLSGDDRETTSVDFAKGQFPEFKDFSIVNGRQGMADAVSSSVFGNPLLYVQTDTITEIVSDYLADMVTCESMVYIFGGGSVVSTVVEDKLKAIKDDAVCLKVIEVSDADELFDALFDQCDYDVIRFVADIDVDVDYDIKLTCDNLIFDLNGYNLRLESNNEIKELINGNGDIYNFIVTADYITIQGGGSAIEIPDGDFLAYSPDNLTLTITGVEFNIPNGDFLTGSFPYFYSETETFDDSSRFNYFGEMNDETNLDVTASSSGTNFDLDISNSAFIIGGSFLVEHFSLDGEATVNIINSEFTLDNNDFEVYIDAYYTNIMVNIINCIFYDLDYFSIAAQGAYLEKLTFGGVEHGLNEIWLTDDITVNGLNFEEEAGEFDFNVFARRLGVRAAEPLIGPSNAATVTLNGDIVLEHAGNVMTLNSDYHENQLKGNALISGEGSVNTCCLNDLTIFDITFEVPLEINDHIYMTGVTLAETLVNSGFTIFRTVTLTDDMVLGGIVNISGDRVPLTSDIDGVTIRGILVGEGDVTIDGDVNELTLEGKLKLKNLTLVDKGSEWIYIAPDATVVFEDVTYNPDDLKDDGDLVIVP